MEIKIGSYTIIGGPLWYISNDDGRLLVTDSAEVMKIIRADDRVERMEAFWKAEH